LTDCHGWTHPTRGDFPRKADFRSKIRAINSALPLGINIHVPKNAAKATVPPHASETTSDIGGNASRKIIRTKAMTTPAVAGRNMAEKNMPIVIGEPLKL
jgi:hypothetical protein